MDENPYKPAIKEKSKYQTRRWSSLFVLGVLLALAPLLGILLTTMRTTSAFQQIAVQEQPRPEDLASGISMAIVPTAVGLLASPIGVVIAIVSALKLSGRKPPA